MKKAGIWLDHRKAVIVLLANGEESMRTLDSKAESRYRLSGGSRSHTPWGPQEKSSEQKQLERQSHQLKRYYLRVLRKIRGASVVLLMGPGEAKRELGKLIEDRKTKPKLSLFIKPADKMTANQILARVKDFYREPRGMGSRNAQS